jgi:hypothetical protein
MTREEISEASQTNMLRKDDEEEEEVTSWSSFRFRFVLFLPDFKTSETFFMNHECVQC